VTDKHISLTLKAHLDSIEGCGDEVKFKVRGHRKNAAGNYEHYTLELTACRHSVRMILAELRKMHVRDRERLAREATRIEREVRELTTEQG